MADLLSKLPPKLFPRDRLSEDALIEFGITLKQQGKPGLRPSQVPYGFRRLDGLLVPYLGEQRVIQSIRKMSSDGLSYRKICDFLTSVGVPTKNQGKG